MTKRDLAAGAFIVAGLYAWIMGLQGAVAALESLRMIGPGSGLSGQEPMEMIQFFLSSLGIPVLLPLIAGYVLIFRANVFAQRLVPDDQAGNPNVILAAGAIDAYAAAISVIGVFLIVRAAPFLLSILFLVPSFTATPHMPESNWGPALAYLLPQAISTLVTLALGALLFFKSGAIAAYWRQRQAGAGSAGAGPEVE